MLNDLRYRLRALFSRAAVERELDDELRFHIDREAEKLLRQGVPPEAARRRAQLAFGGLEQMKEASRDARGTARLESLARDLRYAIRSLANRPAFALTVIATLALGIGANAAIFTLVDSVVLRPLPVSRPDHLVIVGNPAEVNDSWKGSPVTDYVSLPLYQDVRARNSVFTDVYANGNTGQLDVTAGAEGAAAVEHPHARFVTGNYFAVLGVPAYVGRTFTAQEDQTPGEDPVTVLTYNYWRRRFAGSRAAIGSVIHV
ncbi:MAG: permease prefix domain 1-containing protein, partial [Gemmatimonadales bacterium]